MEKTKMGKKSRGQWYIDTGPRKNRTSYFTMMKVNCEVGGRKGC